jgi:hypothetical protein
MPYGTPTSYPAGASYSVGMLAANGVQVNLVINGPSLATESEKDEAFQEAVDAVAALTGWSYQGGFKNYSTEEEITVTP